MFTNEPEPEFARWPRQRCALQSVDPRFFLPHRGNLRSLLGRLAGMAAEFASKSPQRSASAANSLAR